MKSFLIIFFLTLFLNITAQNNSLWISTGYNYGNKKNSNINDMTWGEAQNYSLGSGTATQIFFQHQPDSSNWIAGAGLNILIGNRNPARIQEGLYDSLKVATLTSNSLRAFIQLGYAWQIKKFDFQINAGILIPLATSLKEEINYQDSTINTSQTSVIKNYFTVGFKSNLMCSYPIQKHIRFFASIDYNLLSPMVKTKTIKSYESSNGQQLNDIFPSTSDKETIYWKNAEDISNNKDVSPNTFNSNNPTDKLSYAQSYSSLGFQFGFQFLF